MEGEESTARGTPYRPQRVPHREVGALTKRAVTPHGQRSQSAFTDAIGEGNNSASYGSPLGTAHIFEELLDAEVAVNVTKLREASRQGVDPAYRSIVYRYLLGVAYTDKSREMTMERELERAFDHILSTSERLWLHADGDDDGGRGEGKEGGKRSFPAGHYVQPRESSTSSFIFLEDSTGANATKCCARGTDGTYAAWDIATSRLRRSEPYANDPERRRRMETTMRAFRVYYYSASQYDISHIVALMRPFDDISSHARDVFFCVQSMYHLLTHYDNALQSRRCLQTHCGNLLLLFHATNTALYNHFFAEGVTVLEWVPDMLTTLLAGRLHVDDLLRLWDYYLADIWGTLAVSLHPYVVLAILMEMTVELIECEKSEILHKLNHLPRIDAASILQNAISIRESVYSKGLLPPQ